MRIFIVNEKKPTARSQHSALFFDCLKDFFPTHASRFIAVLEQTHIFFLSTRESKEGVGRTSNYSKLSTGDSYEGVGMGLGGCEGERLRYEMILRSQTHFNYDRNH